MSSRQSDQHRERPTDDLDFGAGSTDPEEAVEQGAPQDAHVHEGVGSAAPAFELADDDGAPLGDDAADAVADFLDGLIEADESDGTGTEEFDDVDDVPLD